MPTLTFTPSKWPLRIRRQVHGGARTWSDARCPTGGGVSRSYALLLLLALPAAAPAQSQAEGEPNRAKAAFQLRKYDEAAARFQKLAEAGNPVAQFFLGRMAATGLGMPKDLAKAILWWQRSAQQGYAEAQAVLGFHYMQGLGVARNYAEAARWSRLAAEQGHGGAAYNLAKLYSEGGNGLQADRAEAQKWAKTAMAKGFPDPLQATPPRPERPAEAVAIFDEGQRLFRAGDMTGAARAFARCAQLGDARCQLQLGWHYEKGKGVPRNLGEAVKWYRAAAEQNDPRASGNLGNMYQFGRGVAKDCKAAVEWYARGALQKDHWSLYSLGRMYYFGFGVREKTGPRPRPCTARRRPSATTMRGKRWPRSNSSPSPTSARRRSTTSGSGVTWTRSTSARPRLTGPDTRSPVWCPRSS
jgi:TPR repeat protein